MLILINKLASFARSPSSYSMGWITDAAITEPRAIIMIGRNRVKMLYP